MSKLTEFYTHLINLCGIDIGNHGRLVYKSGLADPDNSVEITLQYDGKPIVFPDKQYLDDPNNASGEVIVLHPLSESFFRAPSEVQEVLRKAAIVRICEIGDFLLKRAIAINHDATMDENIKLNHKLAKLFHAVGDVDAKFVTWYNKIDKAMIENTSYRLFNIFLKMHGEVGKNKFDRVGVISSPLYDELRLVTDSTTIFGVEGGRKKDIATLTRILEALFPELANDGYMSGSSSGTAPTLMAFMETVALIADRFNTVLGEYGKEAKGIERGTTRGVDFDRNVKLTSLRSAHPIEDYNTGVGKDEAEKRENAPTPSHREKSVAPVLETRTATPRDLDVPVRKSAPARVKEVEVTEDNVPANAFWLEEDRDGRTSRRDSSRDSRDDRYSRDDRDDDRYSRDRRDDRYSRDSRDDRYSRDSRDDRYERDDRYSRDRPRRDYRDDRDYDRSYRDDRSSRDGSQRYFWEEDDGRTRRR